MKDISITLGNCFDGRLFINSIHMYTLEVNHHVTITKNIGSIWMMINLYSTWWKALDSVDFQNIYIYILSYYPI